MALSHGTQLGPTGSQFTQQFQGPSGLDRPLSWPHPACVALAWAKDFSSESWYLHLSNRDNPPFRVEQ